ncbi:transcriptional regulator, AraC family [Thermoanaerobacterium thermosaccharolyticum DSM 571]|uniref:Transcriptional regulator, AraC family n=1 Tax=Thermoanaerobacterium thermosaccharolyticum (strain ATCC 7956 / DSM 571 / NCIMB 9385 / NCA 3814 / NCTC 13789 / WDCM 00135 / 2032) TaxID=580327 RepID=D9TRB1_THETC|nr:helix-turn-helix domain-containing protein [Thermoanaerobacterium thermosaccharolyticum]ADL67931.1 transcriptional regulator, AraC family [Thermoanaerobacterium thermosaccharolyticum DSM 571]
MVFFQKHGVNEKDLFRFFSLKNYQFPFHFHRAYELIYINNGRLSVSIGKKEYILEQNDLAFIFSNQMHEFKTIDFSDITITLFSPELIGDFYMNYKGMIPDDNILHLDRYIDFNELNSIYSKKSFLYSICDKLVKQKSFIPVKQSAQTKVLYKMLLYIEQNYSNVCTLKNVAEHLNYDYPYLSKLFVQQMDMTFTEYLNNYRISQACYMLKNSNLSIGEIASNCGYNNLRTFHRNFRRITNMSPKEYQKLD